MRCLILLLAGLASASVPESESIREYFTLEAGTTTFTFTQPCESADDILVYKRYVEADSDTEGTETLLTVTTDYTIAATGGDYANGGVVTISPALGVNYEVVIVRKTQQSQEVAKGAVTPASVIEMVDRLTRQVQDLQDRLDRCVRLQMSDPESFDVEIPGLYGRAGTYPFFNADGELTFVSTVDASGTLTATPWSETLLAASDAAAARGVIGIDTTDDVEFAGITGTTGTFSGLITANGGVTLGAGDDLIGSATSDITINTNKFTVAGATGNTVIAGSLGVTGVATLGDGSLLAAATEAADTDRTVVDKAYVEDGTTVSYDAEGGYSNCDVDATNTKVYTKYLTGTTDADTSTSVAHGVTTGYSKILAVSAAVGDGSSMTVCDYFNVTTSAANTHRVSWTATNVVLSAIGTAKQSQRYVIRIDYIL